MKFWSKGLGKRCLVVACGTEEPSVEDAKLVMTGTTPPPLSWGYAMHMDGQDWEEFVQFALRPAVIGFMLARPRRKLALRAGWHMAVFVLSVCLAMPGVWMRSIARRARAASSSGEAPELPGSGSTS